ncbi:MAG: choice-of-anchor U domain-containing protein, partial [Aquificaceae bacterium]
DEASAIAISSGYVYVAGWTNSTNFPNTSGGAQSSINGSYDAFVAKLTGNLTNITQATYLGGNQTDEASAIAIDSSGNVYVAGWTESTNFPNTSNGTQSSNNGSVDAFVAKFTGDLRGGGGSGGGGGGNGGSGGGGDGGGSTPPTDTATANTPGGQVQVGITGATFTQTPQPVNIPTPPAGYTAPYGGIQFTAQLPQAGGVITITVTIQGTIPQGAKLYKLINNNYIEVPGVVFSGNTVTFQVQDGSQLDADGQANGAVTDPFVIAVPTSTGGGGDTGAGAGGSGAGTTSGGGGGCSMSFGASPINALLYLLLPLLVAFRRFARK